MIKLQAWRTPLLAVLLLAALTACDSSSTVPANPVGANDTAVDEGRRMYRDGVLPSGEPMTAIVAGDVPVLGTQFSCESCHGRSGMGAAEGTYIVPPVAGQFLFAPSPQPARPAYTVESLANLLRNGETPGGRQLGTLMPKYAIEDAEVEALAEFLKVLSSSTAPGVTDTQIRFATVITDDVDPVTREAVLDVLNTFVEEKNRNTRLESERWDRGNTPESRLPTVYREWVLDVWSLSGPESTWENQLAAYYAEAPIFGMLSGLGEGPWSPVSRFCEQQEMPCLFPGADQPQAAPDDFYTLYYSRGLGLEADLIAAHLAENVPAAVVQVYCEKHSITGAQLRVSLADHDIDVRDIIVACNSEDAISLAAVDPEATRVLWLDREAIGRIDPGQFGDNVYYSSTLLGEGGASELPDMPGQAFIAHPFRLPGKVDPAFARFEVWASTRGVALDAPRPQAEAFFACLAMKEAVMHMGRFFVREYVLDMLDHAQSLVAYLPFHPRPTLGPGQRFLNKGGYVLPVTDGVSQTDEARWINP